MQEKLISLMEQQKLKVFATCDSTEEALKNAHDMLADSPKATVTAAVLQYHNSLINELQNQIRQEKDNHGSPSESPH